MSLSEGTSLGPYNIVSPLGEGGMGEVYRATDSRLKRQVAVKILPSGVAADQTGSPGSSARLKSWPRSIIRTSRQSTGSKMPAA